MRKDCAHVPHCLELQAENRDRVRAKHSDESGLAVSAYAREVLRRDLDDGQPRQLCVVKEPEKIVAIAEKYQIVRKMMELVGTDGEIASKVVLNLGADHDPHKPVV